MRVDIVRAGIVGAGLVGTGIVGTGVMRAVIVGAVIVGTGIVGAGIALEIEVSASGRLYVAEEVSGPTGLVFVDDLRTRMKPRR